MLNHQRSIGVYIYNYMGTALRGAWWFSGRLRALPNVTAHAASMFDVGCVNSQATKTYQEAD